MRFFGVRRLDAAFKLSEVLESDSVANQSAVKPAHSKDALRQKSSVEAD